MTQKIKQILGDKITILGLIIALIATFIHIPRYFEAYFAPLPPSSDVWWGLDSSWIITLNYANIKQLVWGTDFAFTYGPLSYLSTRLGWGTSGYGLIIFDVFLYLNLFLVYFLSFKNSSNKIITAILIIGYTLLIPMNVGSATSLVLLITLVFWIRQSIEKPKFIYYFFQITLLFFLFFIKFNSGLIAFPLFLVGLLYNLISKKEKAYLLFLYAIAPIIIILIACSFLNVDFLNYIKTALEIIKGYNDVMYLDHKFARRALALVMVFATLFVLGRKTFLERKTNLSKNSAIIILYAIPIFVLYKTGFVRGAETDFYIFSVLLILSVQDLHFEKHNKYANVLIVICVLSSFGIVYVDRGTRMPFETTNKIDKHYFQGIGGFTSTSGLHIFPNFNQFPVSVIQKIGTKTVDIYPWNAQLLFENKLNFLPRPVFQSYTAYTKALEEMNFNHYNSLETSPEFVIYEFLSIDQRYPLFDEPKINLCLLKNYKPVEMFDFQNRKLILLERKEDFKPLHFEKINEYAMLMNAPLVPKEDIFYEIGVYNTILGKVASIAEYTPEIKIGITTEDGSRSEYKTSKSLLESGIFYYKIINETKNFNSIFENPEENKKITYYNFKPAHPSQYKDKIKITEYKIIQ